MNDPLLHHGARRIVPNSLETLIEMFEILGCKITYREDNARWAMIGQDGVDFDIQLVEVNENPIYSDSRVSSHIAFVSADPAIKIDQIEKWTKEKNIVFKKGGWNEKELWFDLPELFVDFVVEIMHKSIVGM